MRLSELVEILRSIELAAEAPPSYSRDLSSLVTSPVSDPVIERVVCDSRAVRPGDAFVAVAGVKSDGHDFIGEALARGASAVFAERQVPGTLGPPLVLVPDARRALGWMAHALRGFPARGLELVGITGTKGKTTTSFLVRSVLTAAGRQPGLLGTVQYDLLGRYVPAPLTTPDALGLADYFAELRARGGDSAVMEVSSIALDQSRTAGLDFSVAVFTNLTGDHLDYHGSMDNYREAKARLFRDLAPGRVAVLNADSEASARMAARVPSGVRIVWYSLLGSADVRAEHLRIDRSGSRFTLSVGDHRQEVCIGLVGQHNVSNALAAVGVGVGLGLDLPTIIAGLQTAPAVPGRLEPVNVGQDFTVLVDYAHTDDSLARVLEALRPLTAGRLLVVFGCGGDRDRSKRPRMAAAAEAGADRIFVTSDNPRTEQPEAILAEIMTGFSPVGRARVHLEPDRRLAIGAALAEARAGDVVLIAGKGHEDYQIVGTTKFPFDDRQVAAEWLLGSRVNAAAGV